LKRKDFIQMSAMGLGAIFAPNFRLMGNPVDPAAFLNDGMDVTLKKQLADVALNAATAKGATYVDVRIGRYLNQFVTTRETRVQNIANTESFGAGIRVIANGCWGFAATNEVTKEAIARTAEKAVAVAKANSRVSDTPVQLAPQKGYGDVKWNTPIEQNAFTVPVKDKVDLLLKVNGIALAGGANFVNSAIMAINEQKFFASTDGSYISIRMFTACSPPSPLPGLTGLRVNSIRVSRLVHL
jgi:TldD protein